jgi:hypothetical protein
MLEPIFPLHAICGGLMIGTAAAMFLLAMVAGMVLHRIFQDRVIGPKAPKP